LFKSPEDDGTALPNVSDDGPSYAVFVDPAGYNTTFGNSKKMLAATPGISRQSVSFVETAADKTKETLRWFTFLDDIYFGPGGTPDLGAAGTDPLQRDMRYSWAYLLQRPRTADPSLVNMSVVVFNRRSLALNGNLALSEELYTDCNFDVTRNVVTITWTPTPGTRPPLRAGEWILDATLPAQSQYPHAFFYRVVSINDIAADKVEIEVQTPLRGFPNQASNPGRVIVLEGVVEVFEKGVGRLP
jgi:hypothetical protein